MISNMRKRTSAAVSFLLAMGLAFSPVNLSCLEIHADTLASDQLHEAHGASGSGRIIYQSYLAKYKGAPLPAASVDVDIFHIEGGSPIDKQIDFLDGSPAILSDEDGFVEWAVDIQEEGLYNIYMEYYPVESRGVDIERCVYINGEIPFKGADDISFSRVWTDAEPVKEDNRGNEIRPAQIESPRWESAYFKDTMGYFSEPYLFYFYKGVNRIRLEAVNEPLAIRRLTLKNIERPPVYDEMLRTVDINDYKDTPENFIYIKQGEDAEFRSSPTLHASYDHSSPGTVPYSVDKLKLNMIGGTQWRVPSQWIEWEIDVPENGMYNLTFKNRQNYNRGCVSVRRLTIDGVTPFHEINEIGFKFSGDWNMTTLCGDNGEPYSFPLKKGRHALRLEVTLGDMGVYLNDAEQIVNRLTAAYRKILVLVGTTPDPNRDYQVDKVYPEVMEYFDSEIMALNNLVSNVTDYTGQKSDKIAAAQTLAKQLERFLKKPEMIPKSLVGFKINIGSLADFVLRMSESPLDIDYIVVSEPGAGLPETNTGPIARALHETKSFIASFYVDYNSIGNVYDGTAKPLEVWMLSGRDQSQSLKAIIDDTFTPKYGVSVNVRLVAPNVLLPSVVAGTGPDVALSVASSEPVNFALRGSAVELSEFPGFEELKAEFFDSSFVPYKFNGGIYGLPETQGFPMLFYREDILNDLGIEVPGTWDDVIKALPVLQNNNMDFGLATDDLLSMYGAFLNMLYQRGGSVYTEDGSATMLDSGLSVDAFEFLTEMYTHYKLPKIFNFADRFRTGEMPMGISDYTLFNQLSVSAPEIRGLWNFTVMPGYLDENGNIKRSSTGGGVCSMMLPAAKDKDAAWTFLRWWASSDTQVLFGREMESLIGAAARYATANADAFQRLAWSSAQRNILMEQWQWVKGTPETPGGYYASRHTLNALRKVMNKNEEPRETLLDYARIINDELYKKRKEFGLAN